MPENIEKSEIKAFFKDKCVLITGGSGFLGKGVIEKLLRCCETKTIYILMRPKMGKTAEERISNLFSDIVFDEAKKVAGDLTSRIKVVQGDICKANFGMSDEAMKEVLNEVHVVIHSAASVKFDEPLHIAVPQNVTATRFIIELGLQMKKLEAMVHVSTAFSFCNRKNIDEVVYETPMNYKEIENLIANLSMPELEVVTPRLREGWPNNYTFTKAIAENLVKEYSSQIPTAIFRPSIITPTSEEPLKGWVGNPFGPTGMYLGVGMGLQRIFFVDPDVKLDLVPLDKVVNGVLATVYNTHQQWKLKEDMKVYNFVSTARGGSISLRAYGKLLIKHIRAHPYKGALWFPSSIVIQNQILFWILSFFLHFIPGVLIECVQFFSKQNLRALLKETKIHCLILSFRHFTFNMWNWSDRNTESLWKSLNPQDQKCFHFEVTDLNWEREIENTTIGTGKFLLGLTDKDFLEAEKNIYKMKIPYYIILYTISAFSVWFMLRMFFKEF